MEPRVGYPVVSDVHYHQWKEAREKAEEYRQHEGREARVFFFFFGCLPAQLAGERNGVLVGKGK